MSHETTSASSAGSDAPARQAYTILKLGFIAAPILAGADKFLGLLTDWDKYVPGLVTRLSPLSTHHLMYVVGVIEIVAGIGVALRPKIFANVVAAWLGLIIVNLLLIPGFFDVALRDFGLLLGALALGRLATRFDK